MQIFKSKNIIKTTFLDIYTKSTGQYFEAINNIWIEPLVKIPCNTEMNYLKKNPCEHNIGIRHCKCNIFLILYCCKFTFTHSIACSENWWRKLPITDVLTHKQLTHRILHTNGMMKQ